MDLSNLSSNLPSTVPVTEESVQELSNEILLNFKDAARSVAALYRLSHSKNSLLINKGYLDCLNDILTVMSNGEDVEDWALMRRNELTKAYKDSAATDSANENETKDNANETDEDDDNDMTKTEFKVNVAMAPHKFPASTVPLSLNHSNIQHFTPRMKKKLNSDNMDLIQEDDSEEVEDSVNEENKRRLLAETSSVDKKTKYV